MHCDIQHRSKKSAFAKTHLATLLRVLFGAALLIWLFSKINMSDLKLAIQESFHHWPWWIAALLSTFIGLTIGSVRWGVILRNHGFHLRFLSVFRIFFIGQFFNSFFLGGCGGDLVRAYYAAQAYPDKKTQAASTVLIDRGIGLLTILVFGCIMILARIQLFTQASLMQTTATFMFIFLAGAVTFLALGLYKNLFETIPFLKKHENTKLGSMLKNAYEVLYYYRSNPATLGICIVLSLLNVLFLTLACVCFARSLLIRVALVDYFTMFPVITIMTAIPLTPGGLGIRENLFAEMFKRVGAATFRTIPLSLLVYFGGLFWSLLGGILYMLTPGKAKYSAPS